jgi:ABC-type branched-subunit amino acid transport system ATPase component
MGSDRPILEATGLEAGYSDVNILHGVSVTVRRGSIVCVIGPNGSGKTTLLRALYGFLPLRGGEVVFRPDSAEHDVTRLAPHRRTELGMGFVPQLDNVFQSMTVRENLELGAYRESRRAIAERLERVYDWFPRLADRRRQRAGTLSGGERQMLALARALMPDPQLLVLDEPSAGLAPTVVDVIFEKLVQINEAGLSIVIVEQNARRTLAMSDWGYVLDLGRNRFSGPGSELLSDPKVVELYLGGRGRLAAAAEHAGEDYEAAPSRESRRGSR